MYKKTGSLSTKINKGNIVNCLLQDCSASHRGGPGTEHLCMQLFRQFPDAVLRWRRDSWPGLPPGPSVGGQGAGQEPGRMGGSVGRSRIPWQEVLLCVAKARSRPPAYSNVQGRIREVFVRSHGRCACGVPYEIQVLRIRCVQESVHVIDRHLPNLFLFAQWSFLRCACPPPFV